MNRKGTATLKDIRVVSKEDKKQFLFHRWGNRWKQLCQGHTVKRSGKRILGVLYPPQTILPLIKTDASQKLEDTPTKGVNTQWLTCKWSTLSLVY